MSQLVTTAVSDAFLDVGVVLAMVALVVLAVGDRCTRVAGTLDRHPSLGPLLGGLLGVSPGCSGALLVAPLYARGRVSPGTMAATLVATTGDSAWAMWAGAPTTALLVHSVTFVVGAVVGLVVDGTALARLLRPAPTLGRPRSPSVHGARSVAGRGVAAALRPWRAVVLLPLMAVFWLSTGLGAAWALGVQAPGAAVGSTGLGPAELAGLVGFVTCVVLVVRARRAGEVVVPREGRRRALALLERSATQAAPVVVWVGAAYLALAVVEAAAGPAADAVRLSGPAAVAVGAVVGALPGCGLQIAWTGLYLDGAVDLPGLLANALAQDGDALLPLLVLQRRAALGLTVLTSVPAVLVGGLAVVLL